jgi:hypothetical protein
MNFMWKTLFFLFSFFFYLHTGDPQPSYEEWSAQYWTSTSKPHQEPKSDADWIGYWPTKELLSDFSHISGTIMDPRCWSSCENTILRLETLAKNLILNGHYLGVLPIYVLWDILTTQMLRPSMPSMSKHCRSLYLSAHVTMNLETVAMTMVPLLFGGDSGGSAEQKEEKEETGTTCGFSPVPDKSELALYEEEVVQREQMMGPGGEKKETTNHGDSESDAATLIYSAETDKLQVHKTWLVMARLCVEKGDIGSCRLLLAEAERHSVAFDDAHAMAEIQELRCLVALAEGDVPRAKARLEQCMREKRAIVDVSIATRCVFFFIISFYYFYYFFCLRFYLKFVD